MKHVLLALGLAVALQGCIPFVIGGYIGYEIAQDNAHRDWCMQHVGEESCHP